MMKCPRCRADVFPLQNTCSVCGFDAAALHSYLGNQWVRLERLTDAAHCLRLDDQRRTEVVLDDFERRFPQAFFATYLGVLPHTLNVLELGFWLLNQGAFNTHSVSRRNDFGIVLVVDPSAHNVGISLGYAIEPYFDEILVTRILKAVSSHLARGAFGAAIETACRRSGEVLQKHARGTRWRPEAPAASPTAPELGLQPLRIGHRAASPSTAGLPRS